MKNTMKKLLSLFLVLLMLFTSVPMAFATNGATGSAETETQLAAENGMANIINNLTESEKSEENNGYSIKDVIFEDNTAYVNINVVEQCSLVVAVYDEDTLEMLGSGTETVEASTFSKDETEDIVEVEVDLDAMPDHYLAKAFLLDSNYNALCKEFVCRSYTTAFEVFMDTTPNDFPGKEIVAFDESLDDFGVINDDVVIVENASYTYNNGVYTFGSADEQVSSLEVGDVVYIPLGDEIGDFVLIKVAAIEKNGNCVVITDDEDIAIGDAFQFVRIDADADFTNVSVDEENLGSALEIIDEEEQQVSEQSLERAEIVNDTKETSYSTSFKVEYPKNKSDDEEAWKKGCKISATFKYTIKASARLYYDLRWGKDFYEFKTEFTHTITFPEIKFTGSIAVNKERCRVPIPDIPIGGIFELSINIYLVLSAEASITLVNVALDIYNRVSFNDSDGFSKTNETKWLDMDDPDIGKTKITVKVGAGIELEFGVQKGNKDRDGLSKICATVSIGAEGYVKIQLQPSLVGVIRDKHHDCVFCLTGSLTLVIEGKLSLKLKLISDKLKWTWDAVSISGEWPKGDCYLSISDSGIKFGFGACENISYAVTVTVKDKDDKAVEGATVSTTTGCCDADGDGKFKETSTKTDKNGQATFYFKEGSHTLTAEKDGNKGDSGTFRMLSNAKSVTIKLGSSGDNTGGGTGGSTGGDPDDNTGGSTGGSSNPTDLDLSQSYVYFGSYPQSKVTDSSVISALDAKAPSWENWTSYGYYSGNGSYGSMTPGDWMRFTDVSYGGEKYRGVKFTAYRPDYTENSTGSRTYQDDNGYNTNTVYWFKFEPLKWRVLDASEGLVLCESIIDSQPYSNTIYSNGGGTYGYFNDASYTNYASDYETSSIRKWLNDDFYNTAFTSADQSTIAATTLNNDGYYTSVGTSGYEKLDSNETTDKIFLLSLREVTNSSYGFSSDRTDYDTARRAQGTDYAKCQGLYVYTGNTYTGNSDWLLRSPGYGSHYSCGVYGDGSAYGSYDVDDTDYGVRPALKLNLSSSISQSQNQKSKNLKSKNPVAVAFSLPALASAAPVAVAATATATKTETLKNNEYVLLVVKDAESENLLSSENLLYIDQKAAEANSISFSYPAFSGDFTAKIYGATHSAADHVYGEWKQIKAPTCTESGCAERTCALCEESETQTLDPTGHNFDGSRCTSCGYDRANDCNCNCHKKGIKKLVFKILLVFQKLFGKNKVCKCGAKH